MPIHLLRRLLPPLSALAALGAALGCGGGDLVLPSVTEPSLIEIFEGDEQMGPAGQLLGDALVVRLVDTAGIGVPERAVTWVVATGGGSIIPEAGTTNEEGLATAEWRLGPSAGSNTVSAVVASVGGVTFRAIGTREDGGPPAATRIEAVEGQDQDAPAGASVPVRPAVLVTDDRNQPMEGVEVTFVVTGGGGSVTGDTQTTDSDGIARVDDWTLGSTPGVNTLEARAGSLLGSPVVFTAEGVPAPAGGVDRFVFAVQPDDVEEDESFTVAVALVNAAGDVVPLSGVLVYLGLFREGNDSPSNTFLDGERLRATENGVAVFSGLRVTDDDDDYRFRALSDDLPALGPVFSEPFDVD